MSFCSNRCKAAAEYLGHTDIRSVPSKKVVSHIIFAEKCSIFISQVGAKVLTG